MCTPAPTKTQPSHEKQWAIARTAVKSNSTFRPINLVTQVGTLRHSIKLQIIVPATQKDLKPIKQVHQMQIRNQQKVNMAQKCPQQMLRLHWRIPVATSLY